ncbi:hypothetical protein [Sansalvadorimonas verongulae]|uniref:hypothetical protein n=1 Tax=Sansalvadorimonas verongulae TaxID=2172824 RepID=UPI0012BC5DA5|nr:hypothetical protein [Sansalvadorimonas verongulae]MTI13118.1 hypothetical protein [Sansalvadorimonas verongulae]
MPTAYWPPGLPIPRLGATFQTAEGRLTTDGEVALRERVIDPNHIQTTSATWSMTEREYQVFKAWHFHIIRDGAAWFEVDWDDRNGLARFSEPYSAQQNGLRRDVSAQLEIDYAIEEHP